jgi:hypothetical protein
MTFQKKNNNLCERGKRGKSVVKHLSGKKRKEEKEKRANEDKKRQRSYSSLDRTADQPKSTDYTRTVGGLIFRFPLFLFHSGLLQVYRHKMDIEGSRLQDSPEGKK